ncbi:hypothetical protein [Leptospira interrogans]|uniref:hypothetical protein n=1 Tax=Leptospira interrogans TaxID=173 RepID=UPI0012F85984|nr:hypothetical protein [Leptospira interrogans]
MGLVIQTDSKISTGATKDYVHVDLYFPDRKYPIPLHCYLPKKAIYRNRFLVICNTINLDIREFDSECRF